jgi:hypothetical protein
MNLEFRPAIERVEISHRATRYIGYRIEDADGIIVCLVTGFTGNAGAWIRLNAASVSWDYLEEKMPAIGKYAGDKEGWVQLFADMGIEVFN